MKYAISPASTTWNDFDRAFRDLTRGFFEPASYESLSRKTQEFIPLVEVYENDDYYGLSFDLPGFEKENLHVAVEGEYLVVKGERKKSERAGGSFYTEKTYGSFSRSFELPKDASAEDIKADFKNGVLNLELKKEEKRNGRVIEILS